jgi:hypothetical protein
MSTRRACPACRSAAFVKDKDAGSGGQAPALRAEDELSKYLRVIGPRTRSRAEFDDPTTLAAFNHSVGGANAGGGTRYSLRRN